MSEPKRFISCDNAGFTLVELIVIMIIAGILAATAIPHFFDRGVYDSRGFHDSVISTLRYAQKAAIAQHRFVCVAFGANPASVTLTYDPVDPGSVHLTASCPGSTLTGPSGNASISNSNASFKSTPSTFYFDALGEVIDPLKDSLPQCIYISGATAITVESLTGYVHDHISSDPCTG